MTHVRTRSHWVSWRHRFLAAAAGLAFVAAVGPASARAATPEAVTCGEVITHSIVVANDLKCPFLHPVLSVGADRITIDLAGHTISGNWAPTVSSTGHSYVTIENGSLYTNLAGVALNGDRHDIVRDVTASGGGEGSGVALSGGSLNSVLDSTLYGYPQPGLQLTNEIGDVVAGNAVFGIVNGMQITGGADNQVTRNTTPTMDVSGTGSLIEANVIGPDPIGGFAIAGDQNNVIGNYVSGEGISVTGSGNVLSGNSAVDSAQDGIHVLKSGNTLVANVANDNGAFGIEAVPGVIDGGQNRASGNGNPAQCLNIKCSAPRPPVPATPTGLTATPGNGSVALSWQPNAAGEAVGYYSVYRTDQWFTGPWATPTGTAVKNASSVINGTRYCYQITASNATGQSARSAPVCATPTGPPTPVPSTPSGLTATPTNGAVVLSWQLNPAADAVSYYSVYRTDQQFSGPWATTLATGFTNASEVKGGTRYCYELSATNSHGESAHTASVCATPTGPPQTGPTPTGPTTRAPGPAGVTHSKLVPTPTVAGLHLTRVEISGAPFRAANSGPGLTRHGSAGVLFTYRLSEAATVTVRVERQQTIHGHTRWTTIGGSFSWTSSAGTTKLRFTGRIAGKPLPAGRYRLVLTPHDRNGHTTPPIHSSPFTIKH